MYTQQWCVDTFCYVQRNPGTVCVAGVKEAFWRAWIKVSFASVHATISFRHNTQDEVWEYRISSIWLLPRVVCHDRRLLHGWCRWKGGVTVQDNVISSVGMQFLCWVIAVVDSDYHLRRRDWNDAGKQRWRAKVYLNLWVYNYFRKCKQVYLHAMLLYIHNI